MAKNGKVTFNNDSLSATELDDLVGKDIADKIVNNEETNVKYGIGPNARVSQGRRPQSRRRGMSGFYDKMIPAFANKYTKKWGGKVGTTEIAVETTLGADRYSDRKAHSET